MTVQACLPVRLAELLAVHSQRIVSSRGTLRIVPGEALHVLVGEDAATTAPQQQRASREDVLTAPLSSLWFPHCYAQPAFSTGKRSKRRKQTRYPTPPASR